MELLVWGHPRSKPVFLGNLGKTHQYIISVNVQVESAGAWCFQRSNVINWSPSAIFLMGLSWALFPHCQLVYIIQLKDKFLLMLGFKAQISGVRSRCSANCATTTAKAPSAINVTLHRWQEFYHIKIGRFSHVWGIFCKSKSNMVYSGAVLPTMQSN